MSDRFDYKAMADDLRDAVRHMGEPLTPDWMSEERRPFQQIRIEVQSWADKMGPERVAKFRGRFRGGAAMSLFHLYVEEAHNEAMHKSKRKP